MNRRKAISLTSLIQRRSDEIDDMLNGIKGMPKSSLWTAQLRAATRGGKCMMIGMSPEDATN